MDMRKRQVFTRSLLRLLILFFLFVSLGLWIGCGRVYWRGPIFEKKIALTFDDGPNEPYTSQVLDILKKYNIKAAFFMIGENVEQFPEVVKRAAREGHLIGNHTQNHLIFFPSRSNRKIKEEIERCSEVIEKVIGLKPRLFRPPMGLFGRRLHSICDDLGLHIIEVSIWPKDTLDLETRVIVDYIMRRVKNGSIIVLHDGHDLKHGADRSQSVKALSIIIPKLLKEGYGFTTVDDLLGLEGTFKR